MEPHIQQDLRFILETHGKGIAAQDEKSKLCMAMVEEAFGMYQRSEEDKNKVTQKLEEHLVRISEGLRQKETTIQQLQATIAVQETELSRLQMDMLRLERTSYDGIWIIEIKDYSGKKNEACGEPTFCYKDEFYTGRFGYKICAHVYLNGAGKSKGTHLSVFFSIKKGSHDNYLKWPFQQRVTFTLVNQEGKDDLNKAIRPDAANSSFQKPIEDMNIIFGWFQFVSHSVLENPNGGFLSNNTICIKVTVDPPSS